jgi:hypothetical protein
MKDGRLRIPSLHLAGARGFEPRLTDPKTGVLPLDDAPSARPCPDVRWAGSSVPKEPRAVKKKPAAKQALRRTRVKTTGLMVIF